MIKPVNVLHRRGRPLWLEVSMKYRLLALFALLITAAVGCLGIITYNAGKESIRGIMQERMTSSVKNAGENIALMANTYDSRQLLNYVRLYMTKEKDSFEQRGIGAGLLVYDSNGQLLVSEGERVSFTPE